MANIKEKIISATWRLIKVSGMQNLRVNDIAREADISKRTLYRYFPSKDKLLSFIFEQKQKTMIKELNNILNDRNSQELDKYKKLLNFLKYQLSQRDYRFLDYLKRENPKMYQKIIQGQIEFQNKLEELIERGIKNNEINSKLDPAIISYLIIKLANSIIEPDFFIKNSISIDQVFNNIEELLINGMKRRE